MIITLPIWLIWVLGLIVLLIIIAIAWAWVTFSRAWGNGRFPW